MTHDNKSYDCRYVTMTFDDGLVKGAWKAAEILREYGVAATFYVVTGWVRPRSVRWVRDHFNKNADHGCWEDWQSIAAQGHDIGSHTKSHVNASGKLARVMPGRVRSEFVESFHHIEQSIGRPPSSISMPWNATTMQADAHVRRIYEACRLGGAAPEYARVADLDWHRLPSWAPASDVPFQALCERISSIPAGHWLILQFHSLDGEGYMPISSRLLHELVGFIADQPGLKMRTVREMVESCKLVAVP